MQGNRYPRFESEAWLPKPMRPLVQPIAAWLKIRARVRSVVSLEVVPSLVSERQPRSYPRETPAVEDVAPAARERASHVA